MLGWGAERQERGGGKRGQQKQNGRVAGGAGTRHSSNCTRPREAAQRRGWENGVRCSPGLMYKLKR